MLSVLQDKDTEARQAEYLRKRFDQAQQMETPVSKNVRE